MVNFMNLSTARSTNRAKEVGLRKVSGARRSEVMGQFLGESVLSAFLGLALGLLMIGLTLPLFNTLAGKNLSISGIFHLPLILGLLGMTLLTGLVAGSYPAVFLSAFQPSRVLKGGSVSGGRAQAVLRRTLVVIQFALTLFFVMGTAIVGQQLRFVRGANLGIDTHGVVTGMVLIRDSHALRTALLANPSVLSVTFAAPPDKEQRGLSKVTWEGKTSGDESQFFPVIVDPDYLEVFRVGMAEGRFFSREFPSDSNESIVLNETAARVMGMASPLGKKVTIGRRTLSVIGVIKDFHQSSLHRPIEPMLLTYPQQNFQMCLRIAPSNMRDTLAFLAATSKTFSMDPDAYSSWEILDDKIDGFYQSERKVEAILGLFTAIALFTACLGLLGLASFLAEKRTKEIGIRKVLGAPATGLIWLQSREFSKWILFASLLAGPAAYFASRQWLARFAYRADPSLWIFLAATLATLAVALLAVGYQSIRAALANPIESLRYE
jgi:hypothetical protein